MNDHNSRWLRSCSVLKSKSKEKNKKMSYQKSHSGIHCRTISLFYFNSILVKPNLWKFVICTVMCLNICRFMCQHHHVQHLSCAFEKLFGLTDLRSVGWSCSDDKQDWKTQRFRLAIFSKKTSISQLLVQQAWSV